MTFEDLREDFLSYLEIELNQNKATIDGYKKGAYLVKNMYAKQVCLMK